MARTATMLALALLGVAATASAGGVRCVESGWCVDGHISERSIHKVTFGIKQQNLDTLYETLAAVSEPDSPRYGQHLSLAEVGDMVSDAAATKKVHNWILESVPAEFVHVVKTRDFINVDAPIRYLNKLFAADFKVWKHSTATLEGKPVRMVRTTSHKVPADVSDSLDMVLEVFDFPTSAEIQATHYGSVRSHTASPDTDAAVTPISLNSYYNIKAPLGNNAKNSMAVWETQNQYYAPTDLASFEKTYNLPAIKVANVTGGNQPDQPGVEAQLDIQYIMSTGQGVPSTFWYQTASFFSSFPTIISKWLATLTDDNKAPLVNSVSYGLGESQVTSTPNATMGRIATEVAKLGVRGISILIASGDSGVAGRQANSDPSKCGFDPSWPASIPFVTSVGATQFVNGAEADGETTCSIKPITGTPAALITSGGGFSKIYYRQGYANAAWKAWYNSGVVKPGQQTYEETMRGIPDVSALGHNYQIMNQGALEAVDGTSCSTPAFAGMLARINDRLMNAGKSPIGFANPALYKLAATNPAVFNDITTGNNKCTEGTCCPQGYSAVKGWDPATGLGTPHFEKLSAAFLAM